MLTNSPTSLASTGAWYLEIALLMVKELYYVMRKKIQCSAVQVTHQSPFRSCWWEGETQGEALLFSFDQTNQSLLNKCQEGSQGQQGFAHYFICHNINPFIPNCFFCHFSCHQGSLYEEEGTLGKSFAGQSPQLIPQGGTPDSCNAVDLFLLAPCQ